MSTYNAFDDLEKIIVTAYSPSQGPMDVVLVDDLRNLIGLPDTIFNMALENAKFSSVIQGVNLQCFFTSNEDVGEFMTVEAAIATASMCPPNNEFVKQMIEYVHGIVDFCSDLSTLDIESKD